MPLEVASQPLRKAPSGVEGLDEITYGGLPHGRPTLVCGSAGCGKTLFGVQFLVRGILDHDEPGVFMSFEESAAEIAQNVRSLNWDLDQFELDRKLAIDHVRIEPSEIQEAGAYDLDGLFIRLGAAIDSVGAKRVVLDTLEVLFSAFKDQTSLRAELRRLFRWLKEREVTTVITAERGEGALTRHGLEEYVSDCVILLDHRVIDQLSTRRMRVVKYRGSAHSSDECPFIIDEGGFQALPLTSMRLAHEAPTERVSSGVARLDAMLGGKGYFRGSSVLISGTPGSGKTTLAASFIAAGCARGERALLMSFEESPKQLARNLSSVGVDLAPHIESGLLRVLSTRPSAHGLESHLARKLAQIVEFEPDLVVVDPLNSFGAGSSEREAMIARLIDMMKSRGITAVCTGLDTTTSALPGLGVTSVIDTWLALSSIEFNGERNRGLTIVKSRGMSHSNQVREFALTDDGIELRDVYTGPAGVLMGTARHVRETEEAASGRLHQERTETKRRQLERRQAGIDPQVLALRAQLQDEVEALSLEIRADELEERERALEVTVQAHARGADAVNGGGG